MENVAEKISKVKLTNQHEFIIRGGKKSTNLNYKKAP